MWMPHNCTNVSQQHTVWQLLFVWSILFVIPHLNIARYGYSSIRAAVGGNSSAECHSPITETRQVNSTMKALLYSQSYYQN